MIKNQPEDESQQLALIIFEKIRYNFTPCKNFTQLQKKIQKKHVHKTHRNSQNSHMTNRIIITKKKAGKKARVRVRPPLLVNCTSRSDSIITYNELYVQNPMYLSIHISSIHASRKYGMRAAPRFSAIAFSNTTTVCITMYNYISSMYCSIAIDLTIKAKFSPFPIGYWRIKRVVSVYIIGNSYKESAPGLCLCSVYIRACAWRALTVNQLIAPAFAFCT